MKLCKKCSEIKPLELFKKNKNCKDGYEHTCKSCTQKRQHEWEVNNYSRHRANQTRWRDENPDKMPVYRKKWIKENKEAISEYQKKYIKENAGWKNAHTAKRRAKKLLATPIWANMDKIRDIYIKAKEEGLVVDHIIPLQNDLVCGLHVENNLQLLTASENSKKNNSFDPNAVYKLCELLETPLG